MVHLISFLCFCVSFHYYLDNIFAINNPDFTLYVTIDNQKEPTLKIAYQDSSSCPVLFKCFSIKTKINNKTDVFPFQNAFCFLFFWGVAFWLLPTVYNLVAPAEN